MTYFESYLQEEKFLLQLLLEEPRMLELTISNKLISATYIMKSLFGDFYCFLKQTVKIKHPDREKKKEVTIFVLNRRQYILLT